MDLRLSSLIFLAHIFTLVIAEPQPQFYPFTGPPQQHYIPQDQPVYPGPQNWAQQPRNFSAPPNFLNPMPQGSLEDLLRSQMPRQGFQPPVSQGTPVYPQIYKVDNLIIIANPSQVQQQPCIPRRPVDLPNPGGDDLLDRGGSGEPSKCTWAIVACCSPGNNNVRYNCFELLGCPGFFFDNSPCEPKTVMAAAAAALEYYRGANNVTRPGNDARPGDSNRL